MVEIEQDETRGIHRGGAAPDTKTDGIFFFFAISLLLFHQEKGPRQGKL